MYSISSQKSLTTYCIKEISNFVWFTRPTPDGSSVVASQGCRRGEGQPFRNVFSLFYCILLHFRSVSVQVQVMNIWLVTGTVRRVHKSDLCLLSSLWTDAELSVLSGQRAMCV